MKKLSAVFISLFLGVCVYGNEICFKTAELTYQNRSQKIASKDEVITLKGAVHFWTKKTFAPEPGKKYRVSAELRTDCKERIPGVCVAVIYFNEKDQFIWGREYMTVPKSMTVLARPAAMTDQVIYVKDSPAWKKIQHRKLVVAFEAKEDESDLPNAKVSTVIKNMTRENGVIKVELTKPLYAVFPAGTAVRLHCDTSFYQPCPENTWYNFPKAEWKTVGGPVKIPAGVKRFRPAIVYYDWSKNSQKSFELRNFKLIAE